MRCSQKGKAIGLVSLLLRTPPKRGLFTGKINPFTSANTLQEVISLLARLQPDLTVALLSQRPPLPAQRP